MMDFRQTGKTAILTPETFRFFSELTTNNSKSWMDMNRDRYQQHVVGPLRDLLEALTPEVLKLDGGFVVTGHTGLNFSRINRDIRFAKDKTPYNPRMYVLFPDSPSGEGSELYVGIMPDAVTTGFRIYADSKSKMPPLTVIGAKRAAENLAWIGKQKKRLSPKYESYWYSSEKGVWTKHDGWPAKAPDWKKLRAWIVRRKMTKAAAMRPGFIADVGRAFRDVAPLCAFASSPNWKA
jgi:uncharacterized protein (TIGR02453 family)